MVRPLEFAQAQLSYAAKAMAPVAKGVSFVGSKSLHFARLAIWEGLEDKSSRANGDLQNGDRIWHKIAGGVALAAVTSIHPILIAGITIIGVKNLIKGVNFIY